MKRYNYCFITLWVITAIVVCGDIFGFLYAEPYNFNAYPILPFNVHPSCVRGTHRLSYSMEGIFEMEEYSDEGGKLKTWVERPHELDSLCISSVIQYAWTNDSLLMEISINDGSTKWLLASPASSKNYRCKLQEIAAPNNSDFSSWHNIRLHNNGLTFYMQFLYFILHIILLLSIPILNMICLILTIMACYKHNIVWANAYQKFFYILFYGCTTVMPITIWKALREITFFTMTNPW